MKAREKKYAQELRAWADTIETSGIDGCIDDIEVLVYHMRQYNDKTKR